MKILIVDDERDIRLIVRYALAANPEIELIEAAKFSANHVKVVTEAGSVYLLGLVTEREGKDAIEIARTTAGVRKVVTLLETISEEQAKALDRRPDPETKSPAK